MTYVTQNREDLPLTYDGTSIKVGNNAALSPVHGQQIYRATRFQTTSSWRTGRLYSSSTEDGSSAFEGTSGTRAEFQRELEEDNRQTSVNTLLDNGHEFKSVCDTITVLNKDYRVNTLSGHPFWGNTPIQFAGVVLPLASWNLQPNWPVRPEPTPAEIRMDGAELWNRSLPTRPAAGLTQFLGELREMLPQIVGHALIQNRFGPAGLGGEHLNIQFGIKPFANDLKKLASMVIRGNQLLRQYRRDSHRVVRRKRTLYEDRSSVSYRDRLYGFTYWNCEQFPYAPEGFFLSDPGTTVTDVWDSRVWFSGAFSYYLENMDSFIHEAERFDQKANRLLGTRLTADVLWELTPWSWLLDWVGNFSTVVQNAEALSSDSLVCRYGYVMHQFSVRREYTKAGLQGLSGQTLPAITMYLERSSKSRVRATPYGFGLDLSLFSARQWAILAALGLARSPDSLRLDEKTSPPLKPQKGFKRLPRTPRKPRIRP